MNSDYSFVCCCTKGIFFLQNSLAYVICFVPSFVFIQMSLEGQQIIATVHPKSFGLNNFYQATWRQKENSIKSYRCENRGIKCRS
jgi:hypothetical protein